MLWGSGDKTVTEHMAELTEEEAAQLDALEEHQARTREHKQAGQRVAHHTEALARAESEHGEAAKLRNDSRQTLLAVLQDA